MKWPDTKKPNGVISPAEFEEKVAEIVVIAEDNLRLNPLADASERIDALLLDTLSSIGYGAGIELIRGMGRDSGERTE